MSGNLTEAPLSMNDAGKWALISIFVGLALTIIWTVVWELSRRKTRERQLRHDLEAAMGLVTGRVRPEDVRNFIVATAMSPMPEPGRLATDQPLVDNPQHHAPQLPPLNLPGPLAP